MEFSGILPTIRFSARQVNQFIKSPHPISLIAKTALTLIGTAFALSLMINPAIVIPIAVTFLGYSCLLPAMRVLLSVEPGQQPSLRLRLAERYEYIRQNAGLIGLDFTSKDRRYDPDERTPDEFICPITLQIIRIPVMINDGTLDKPFLRAYEYRAIKRWYDQQYRLAAAPDRREQIKSPLSRAPLNDPYRLPIATDLREKITRYVISR